MKAIIVFGGFTEQDFDLTGSVKLYHELVRLYGRHHIVRFAEWHEGAEVAELLRILGVSEALVAAYSWGAGKGLRDMSKRFLGPITAVLCDPVFRSRFPWMRWRALTRWWVPVIHYADHVKIAGWFTQRLDQPGGDKIEAKHKPRKPKVLPYVHTQIDDSPQYRKAVLDAAKKFAQ